MTMWAPHWAGPGAHGEVGTLPVPAVPPLFSSLSQEAIPESELGVRGLIMGHL